MTFLHYRFQVLTSYMQCDQVPEGCGQCAKQRAVCPGYRDQLELLFRNESQNVVRKAKARQAKAKQGSPSTTKVSTPPSPSPPYTSASASAVASYPAKSEIVAVEDLAVVIRQDSRFPTFLTSTVTISSNLQSISYRSLGPTLEERATSFFVSNYVIGVKGPTRGHLESLETTYHFDDNLMASIKAVGLAGFANVERSSDVMKEARKEYSAALRLTNLALRSSRDAKKDSTLLSIMILSIYETVAGTNQKSLKSWAEHIRGAAALVKLRGPEQLSTPEGRRLVIQVTTNLLISCIQRELPLPDYILELREDIKKRVDSTEPAWHVQELMIQFCAFRAATRDGTERDPRWILAKALDIEAAFSTVFMNPPLSWRYETRYNNSDKEHIWNGCYHVYYDYWVAQIWNGMRTCRMMLNEVIRDVLLQGFQSKPPVFSAMEHTAQFQLSTDVLFQMQAEVLASVPQHLGFSPQKSCNLKPGMQPLSANRRVDFEDSTESVPPIFRALGDPPNNEQSYVSAETQLPVLRASGGYFLMWPLFLAAVIDVASDESRQWIVGRQRAIGRTMGIRQAEVLATVIERRLRIRAWMTDQAGTSETRQGPYMEDTEDIELNDEEWEKGG